MMNARIGHWRTYRWIITNFILLVVGQPTMSRAEIVVVQNAGFEDVTGSTVFNEFTFGPPVGWDFYDPNGIVINNGAGPQFWLGTLQPSPPEFFDYVPEGDRVAILFNFFGSGNLGEYGLEQTLAATLQANSRYTLEVEIGNIASGTALNNQFFNLDGFPGYRVDLLAGGVVIASDNNTLANLIPEGDWLTSVLQFQTADQHDLLGQSLGIRLVSLNVVDPTFPNADLEVDFDNVRLSMTAVPEPATLGFLGATCVGILLRRQQKVVRIRN
jgi:hypothetical protein